MNKIFSLSSLCVTACLLIALPAQACLRSVSQADAISASVKVPSDSPIVLTRLDSLTDLFQCGNFPAPGYSPSPPAWRLSLIGFLPHCLGIANGQGFNQVDCDGYSELRHYDYYNLTFPLYAGCVSVFGIRRYRRRRQKPVENASLDAN